MEGLPLQHKRCYQEAANNKEHIDANKTYTKPLKASVEKYDR
jgi:hypothetical protein